MRTTPNLGLTVWDANGDQFDHAELAANWDLIDADFSRTRPTDRAEVLATVPAAGNFEGRLVYLSAADGGFAAGTLIRYRGGSWATIGPVEVLGAVPAAGNYQGRVVFLSAANGGFEQYALIVYDGTSFRLVNRSYEVAATLPGHSVGRLVYLTASDGGFAAGSFVRSNGSAWALVGPQPIPPGTELAYSTVTADTTTTNATTPGVALVTFGAATFENVKYYLEINIPMLYHSIASEYVHFLLRESGATVGNPIRVPTSTTANRGVNIQTKFPFTPTAGSKTYSVNWFGNAAGTSGIAATGFAPAVFRIFKA